jgi:hypothetical protein
LYPTAELQHIFLKRVEESRWRLESPLVATVAVRRLARGAGQKGFGNARAVETLIDTAQKRANRWSDAIVDDC